MIDMNLIVAAFGSLIVLLGIAGLLAPARNDYLEGRR